MKKQHLNNIIRITVVLLIILLCNSSYGAPPPPPGPPSCWPPPCVIPFDGGITLLMAAGALYGSKKLYDLNQKNPV